MASQLAGGNHLLEFQGGRNIPLWGSPSFAQGDKRYIPAPYVIQAVSQLNAGDKVNAPKRRIWLLVTG